MEVPVIQRVEVPEDFLTPCELPVWPDDPILWGDLVLIVADYQAALDACDARIGTIRTWNKE